MKSHPGYCVSGVSALPPLCTTQLMPIAAPRFKEAAKLGVTAEQMGLRHISDAIINAINADRASFTIKMYTSVLEKFRSWRSSPYMSNIPTPQARNLYLAKFSADGKHSTMTTVVAALNYFFGPLQGVDQDPQNSLLQAIKRAASPCKHRAEIQPHHMTTIINLGNADSDPKVIQQQR
ncbi:hypothetical protein GCK32_004073 [Trichostrongylus colubriformis]|uniref:Uncharacterized protein n=1 Tax=Trichostrongylus colubriformis TaxID=6319 RepID=A0AAN8FG05_TRICO